MESRPRALAAIVKNDSILMVLEKYPDKTFWTLPGGGVEEGESYEEAVIREVREEVNLKVEINAFLFEQSYDGGIEKCFLVKVIGDSEPKLGYDPESSLENQTLSEVKWQPIEEMKKDRHVSKVIEILNLHV